MANAYWCIDITNVHQTFVVNKIKNLLIFFCICIGFVIKVINFVLKLQYSTPNFPGFSPQFIVWKSWLMKVKVSRQILVKLTFNKHLMENRVVYDGHKLWLLSFRLWLYPVGGYQTCSMSELIKKITTLFSFFTHLLATRYVFLLEFVVFGTL